MPGTITLVSDNSIVIGNGRGQHVVCTLVLDSSGNIADEPISVQSGFLTDVEVISGATVPTTGYDLQLKTEIGADLLGDDGLSLNAALPQRITKNPAMVVGNLYPTITGAGAGAELTLCLYLMGL